jgi:hypothetical protein
MSATSVETILSRAMSDSAFADQLFVNPDQSLAGFELTTEEAAIFKNMARVDFDKLVQASPEERKSMGVQTNHNESALYIR